jgi:hypothetical protein
MMLVQAHASADKVSEQAGWDLRLADDVRMTDPPTDRELGAFGELFSR